MVIRRYESISGVELFCNNSNHKETDGFLLMSNAQVNFLRDEDTGRNIIEVVDPNGVSRSEQFDVSLIMSYKLDKIRSEHGKHRLGRLVFEIPLDDNVGEFLGIAVLTSKLTIKFPRDDYQNFCRAFLILVPE